MIEHLHLFYLNALTGMARFRDERGANLVEYALLVALIAVVCVTAVSLLGSTAKEPFSQVSSRIGSTS